MTNAAGVPIPERIMEEREVFSCPICGWESFDEDAYEQPCGQTDCPGRLTEVRTEPYEV